MDEDDNGKFRLERVKSRMGGGGGSFGTAYVPVVIHLRFEMSRINKTRNDNNV